LESVSFAAFFTVIEILGLLLIIATGLWTHPELVRRLTEVLPPISDHEALLAVFSTIFVAFFAFIGFDDVVNLVEEVHDPARTVPIGIIVTLVLVAILYFMVVSVAVLTIPIGELSKTNAPISLIFERLTGLPPFAVTMIAVVATMNGIIIQIIMGSRVLYGMARKGRLPAILAYVNPRTKTPLVATGVITSVSLTLALLFPIEQLAGLTTQIVLFVFALVNLALLRMKMRGDPKPEGIFTVSSWVAFIGFVSCLGLLIGAVSIG
jgi:amino acid transporter